MTTRINGTRPYWHLSFRSRPHSLAKARFRSVSVRPELPSIGPFHHVKLPAAEAFQCLRCGKRHAARQRAIYLGDSNGRLCKACYAYLLSVYQVKAGSDPDDVRADLLDQIMETFAEQFRKPLQRTVLLMSLVGVRQYPRAETVRHYAFKRFGVEATRPELVLHLCPEAVRFLATADAVANMLRTATELDWSVAVIGLCKAFEVEVARQLLDPLREELKWHDLSRDINDPRTRELARYAAGHTHRPPPLGTTAFVFGLAGEADPATSDSVILQAIRGFAARNGSDWLVSSRGFVGHVRALTRRYRNPAGHIDRMERADFDKCRDMLFGVGGVSGKLLASGFASLRSAAPRS